MLTLAMSYGRRVWMEVIVWSAISLIIASFIARLVYGRQLLEAEDRLGGWLGITPDVHFILKIVLAVLGLCYLFSRWGPFHRTN